ncbi:MAG: hypothetical protein DRN18_03710, partial [Thermoplasmata archaeon]
QRFMQYFLLYILVLGLPLSILMRFGLSVIVMLSITLLFIGVVGVVIYGIGTIYVIQTTLPEEYRSSKLTLFAGTIAIILLLVPFLSFAL